MLLLILILKLPIHLSKKIEYFWSNSDLRIWILSTCQVRLNYQERQSRCWIVKNMILWLWFDVWFNELRHILIISHIQRHKPWLIWVQTLWCLLFLVCWHALLWSKHMQELMRIMLSMRSMRMCMITIWNHSFRPLFMTLQTIDYIMEHMMTPLRGMVQQGKKLSRTVWFPTANIATETYIYVSGTWIFVVDIGGEICRWVWPIFVDRQLVEVHILEYTGDLYGKEICVYPVIRLRDNKMFEDTDVLLHAIQKDVSAIKNCTIRVLTFGTFDHIHLGHRAYLQQAKAYGNNLACVVALDETVRKIKWRLPDHSQEERKQAVERLCIADTVILWHPTHHYSCLDSYQPHIVYVWYDQHSFDEGIQSYCKEQWYTIPHVIRWTSYMPERYKSSLIKQVKK